MMARSISDGDCFLGYSDATEDARPSIGSRWIPEQLGERCDLGLLNSGD